MSRPHRQIAAFRLVWIVACLLFGVVSTTGTAWLCIILSPSWKPVGAEMDSTRLLGLVDPFSMGTTFKTLGADYAMSVNTTQNGGGIVKREIHTALAAGFPFRASWCAWVIEFDQYGGRVVRFTKGAPGIQVRRSTINNYVLPVTPLWGGLLLNTLIHALVIWLPLFLVGQTRRRRRERLGLCICCGYDCRGAVRCPECDHKQLPPLRQA